MPTDKPATCHDCGCREGEIHERGCDMENCPFCGHQLISCSCCYKQLGYDYHWDHPTSGLPQEVFEHGLPPEQQAQWEAMLKAKGRVPYIQWPNLCAYCGELWPEMFRVPDEEWAKYIELGMRREMVCPRCWRLIKKRIDAGRARKKPTRKKVEKSMQRY